MLDPKLNWCAVQLALQPQAQGTSTASLPSTGLLPQAEVAPCGDFRSLLLPDTCEERPGCPPPTGIGAKALGSPGRWPSPTGQEAGRGLLLSGQLVLQANSWSGS